MASSPAADPAARVSWEQVTAFRLSRHHLATPLPRASLVRAAGDMCGAQSQFPIAAALSLRARVRGLGPEDVDRALAEERSLVKAWSMRNALHLLPSDEYGVFVKGCRAASRWHTWLESHRVPMDQVDRIVGALTDALDRPRTRSELGGILSRALGLPTTFTGSRGWGSPRDAEAFRIGRHSFSVNTFVQLASIRGFACFGPPRGNEATVVRCDAWIPGWRDIPPEEADARFLERYLRAYGPARTEDFAFWAGLRLRDARDIVRRSQDSLAPVSVDDGPAWSMRDDVAALERARLRRPVVRLLPHFDTFLMGRRDRGHLVDAAHQKRVFRPAGWIYPTVLVDGRVAGVWQLTKAGRRTTARVEPFRRLSREVKEGIEAEAEDVGRFLGTEVRLAVRER